MLVRDELLPAAIAQVEALGYGWSVCNYGPNGGGISAFVHTKEDCFGSRLEHASPAESLGEALDRAIAGDKS